MGALAPDTDCSQYTEYDPKNHGRDSDAYYIGDAMCRERVENRFFVALVKGHWCEDLQEQDGQKGKTCRNDACER